MMSFRSPLCAAAVLASAVGGCSSAPPAATAPAPGAGGAEAASVKAEPHVEVLWKQRVGGGSGSPQVVHLVGNAAGDVLMSTSTDEVGVFRFDATDHLVWRRSIQSFRSWLGGAGLDAAGNVYGTAWFDSDVRMGGQSISEATASSVFLLKLDGEGKKVWSTVLDGSQVGGPTLVLGAADELLLAGNFGTDLVLGKVPLMGDGSGSSITGNLFLAQLDGAGTTRWARAFPGRAFVTQMVMDGAGAILLSGDFWGELGLDPSSPMKAQARQGDGRDHFLAKLDATGRLRWARHLEAQQIAVSPDGSGEMFICPLSGSGPNEIRKIAADGRVLSKVALPAEGPSCGDLAAGAEGMLYVVGQVGDGAETVKSSTVAVAIGADGKVVSRVVLPVNEASEWSPRLLWSRGRLLAAGITGRYKDPSFYLAKLTL